MDKALAKQLGKVARRAREALGFTQAEVAERIDVSTEFYARLERGDARPSVPTLTRLVRVLHVSADDLLGNPSTGGVPPPDE